MGCGEKHHEDSAVEILGDVDAVYENTFGFLLQ